MPHPEELVDSAIEFLGTSCDQYGDGSLEEGNRLKHSTVSISTGIELLLKARLAQEHWTLLLLSSDRYRNGDWQRGSFVPVGLRETLARLSELCSVNISQQAETAFADLADLRNKFVHFRCEESAERVTGIQLRAWHHVMDLLDHGLLSLDEPRAESLQLIRKRMLEREEALASRFDQVGAAISERAAGGADIITCPFCAHPALAVGDGAVCLVCGSSRNEAGTYAEEYARRAAPWMSSDEYYNTQWTAMCSECREHSCVVAPAELKVRCEETILEQEGISREPGVELEPWYCFNCGAVYDSLDIAECTRCGRLFGRSGGESLCPDCSW